MYCKISNTTETAQKIKNIFYYKIILPSCVNSTFFVKKNLGNTIQTIHYANRDVSIQHYSALS